MKDLFEVLKNMRYCLYGMLSVCRGVATNNGLRGQVQIGTFFVSQVQTTNVVQKSLMFFHRVNTTEHNRK